MIEEYNNPKTLLSRKKAGISLEFELGRATDKLMDEISVLKNSDNQTEKV
jgi:hypothetical protein